MNVKIFNLMSGKIEIQHESCECKYRFNESVCNLKQRWNHDECWCECKELDDWDSCEQVYMLNPSACDCKCNKTCKINEYLDTKSFSC